MDVVAHEYISIKGIVVAIFVDGQELNELLVIGRVFEYFLFLVSARDDVIECSLELYSRLPRHGTTISKDENAVKIAIFKSDPIRSPYGPWRMRFMPSA